MSEQTTEPNQEPISADPRPVRQRPRWVKPLAVAVPILVLAAGGLIAIAAVNSAQSDEAQEDRRFAQMQSSLEYLDGELESLRAELRDESEANATAVEQLRNRVESVATSSPSSEQVSQLQSRLEQLQDESLMRVSAVDLQVATLREQVATLEEAEAAEAEAEAEAAEEEASEEDAAEAEEEADAREKSVTVVRRPPPPQPHFNVMGRELRGGQEFIAVAPRAASSLNDIRLIQEGDRYDNWLLSSINGREAVFTVAGRQVSVAL